ncbi:MFS transporter [Prauserella halophila]|uniref:MFS transporter n=1 Tax=Prauserella halophila TaxID=185641 RepID=A0ABP4GSZ3_9PSEU|nr:MFS transporter [Prauserella halophila]MCP2236277.1 benzoate transport [Prauserella halophila]
MSHDLRAELDEGPMHGSQWVAIAVCVLLNMLDGFDVLVMAFTGDSVSAEFGLNGAQLGLLLSAGLVGMAAGSLLLAPFADRFGRRPVILMSLGIASAGMLLASMSGSALALGLLRVLTGLGIGGILACSNTIAAEYASRRWRGLAVSLNSTGYALGATLGGVIAVVLIGAFGWRSVFLFGGVSTLAAIPIVLIGMPESLDFLLTRRPNRALEKANRVARRFRRAPLAELPPISGEERRTGVSAGFRTLLGPGLRRGTLILWTSFFLVMAGFYFVTSWTPTLLVEAGMSATEGLTGGTLLNLGGIFGAAALGALAARWPLRNVLIVYLVTTAAMLALFLLALGSLAAAFAGGALIGLFVNGCVAGLYALTPSVYGSDVRATGVGTAISIGRIGAILSPTIAGTLLDAGWTPQHLYLVFGIVFVLTAVALSLLRGERHGSTTDTSAPAATSNAVG